MPDIPTLDPVQVRVLGSLIEKSMTTPDQYPLTGNALKNACNQKSNRDPVASYDEPNIRNALSTLQTLELIKVRSMPGSYVPKYAHHANKTLELTSKELSILCTLMLRGPQTLGEIRTRTQRLVEFSDLADVERILERLRHKAPTARVVMLPRQPSQKESRYAHTLGGEPPWEAEAQVPTEGGGVPNLTKQRLANLEQEMAALREDLASLEERLAILER